MGHNSHFSGSVEIDPPLNWSEIRKAHELPHVTAETLPRGTRNSQIVLAVNQHEENTDQGTNTVKLCYRINPFSDFYTGFLVQEAIQSVVDAFGDDHTFSGHIEERAEDNAWHHRFAVKEGRVRKIKPVITWVEEE